MDVTRRSPDKMTDNNTRVTYEVLGPAPGIPGLAPGAPGLGLGPENPNLGGGVLSFLASRLLFLTT